MKFQEIGFRRPAPVICVYFLLGPAPDYEVLYVGKTKNLHARLCSHKTQKRFKYYDVRYMEVEAHQLSGLELAFIKKYDPKHNKAGTARQTTKSFYGIRAWQATA